MNTKSNLTKVVTIIFCIVAIIAVIFAKTFQKEEEKKATKTADSASAEIIKEENTESVITDETNETEESEIKEDPNAPTNPELEEYIDGNQLEDVDDSLYTEDAGDGYQEEGDREITIWFSNIEVLGNDLPVWVFTHLNENLQFYINLNITDQVGEMTIIEDSISIDDKMCFFSIDLNNGRICTANIDLEKKEFVFGDHEK